MDSSTVDHSAEHEELAGLYALEALDGDDLVAFERHLGACAHCQGLVAQDRNAATALSALVLEMDPSPGFKERLMRRAAEELAQQPVVEIPAPPVREPIPFRRDWRRLAAVIAAVLVLGVAGVWGGQAWTNHPVTTVALASTSNASLPGSAQVVVRRSGSAELDMRGMDDPPAGHVYEAWVIAPGQAPVPAGTISAGQGTVQLPGDVRNRTVAVTLEVAPGAPAPTSAPFLAAEVGA